MGVRIVALVVVALCAAACEGAPPPVADQGPATSAAAQASAAASADSGSSSAAPADGGPDMPPARPLSPRLAAKLAQRVEAIEAAAPMLVAPYGGGRMQVVDDTFVLVAGEKDAPLEEAAKTVHAATQALWRGWFVHRPTTGAAVFVFRGRDNYAKFVSKSGPKGVDVLRNLSFYLPESDHVPGTSEVYFCAEGQGLGGLGHEISHHLITRGDFPRAPRFIEEGFPALLEAADPQPDTGDLRLEAHFRLQTLRDALARPAYAKWVTVQSLFEITEDSFWSGAGESLAYAVSREFLRFLEVRKDHALLRFYSAFRDGWLDDPSGLHALEAATGVRDEADLTPEFQSWILSADAEKDEP